MDISASKMFGALEVRLRFRGVEGPVFSGLGVADRLGLRGDFGTVGCDEDCSVEDVPCGS